MLASEGIDSTMAYTLGTEIYQDGISQQGCCWYLTCDIACYDRTDHVDGPLQVSEPEPVTTHDADDEDLPALSS